MPYKNQTLTPLELEIMQVLWQSGPCTVGEVQPKLRAELAYTTVQTMLNVLLRKKKVKRVQEGRAYRYRAAVSRERTTGTALSDLVKRLFGGSSEALLMAMVDTEQIRAEELARIAQRLAAAESTKEKNDGASDRRVHRKRLVAGSPSCRGRMVITANGPARSADTTWGLAGRPGTGGAAAPPCPGDSECTLSRAAPNHRSYIIANREPPAKPEKAWLHAYCIVECHRSRWLVRLYLATVVFTLLRIARSWCAAAFSCACTSDLPV